MRIYSCDIMYRKSQLNGSVGSLLTASETKSLQVDLHNRESIATAEPQKPPQRHVQRRSCRSDSAELMSDSRSCTITRTIQENGRYLKKIAVHLINL